VEVATKEMQISIVTVKESDHFYGIQAIHIIPNVSEGICSYMFHKCA
jgi:alpha/beta superfamily hydrolase